MKDGRILRGPIAFHNHRVYMNTKKRNKKKNKLFELKGRYNRRAKRMVPYFRKQYMRKWELKSLPFWYREHWANLEVEEPIPLAYDRRVSPRQLENFPKKTNLRPRGGVF